MARTTLSTKASCPRTVFYLGGKAFKAAQVLRLHVGGAPGQQAFVLHVPQHLAAAFQRGGGGIALGFELGVLLLQQLVQPFLLFQKRRVQVGQGGAAACFGCRSAGGGLESAPGPNTPFIRLSQSSVYAIKLPSVQCFFFQYSGVWYVLQGKG